MASFEFTGIKIAGISATVPKNHVYNNSYESVFGKDVVSNFINKTGVVARHIALEEQTTSDLGYISAKNLLDKKEINPEEISLILFISKTPDYRNPPSAAVLQYRLNLPVDSLAYDINHGSMGFIMGMQVGCSLMQSMPGRYGLLIIGDTSSKQISKSDLNSLGNGDGASAILLEKTSECKPIKLLTQSESTFYNSYILREGGFRISSRSTNENIDRTDAVGESIFLDEQLFHDFIISKTPLVLANFLHNINSTPADFDLVAFHQEDKSLLERIAHITKISSEMIATNLAEYGNTCGASIPLLLCDTYGNQNSELKKILCFAFGEGFSIGVTAFEIHSHDILPIIKSDESFTEGAVSREL